MAQTTGEDALGGAPLHWPTFLDTPPSEAALPSARVVVVPVPYDSTTSYKAGARRGPAAIIAASRHLEDYDAELDRDISLAGIHTTAEVAPDMRGPKAMVERVRRATLWAAGQDRLVALLGGEHTIAIGAVQAMTQLYPDLSTLYLDAHADMRDSYMGTRWGHASVARRIREICPIAQVGVRSLSAEEMGFIRKEGVPAHFHTGSAVEITEATNAVIDSLSRDVYVSIDLDVFDPSIMAAVGTPEPGGMSWSEVMGLLRTVGENRRIVGFDVSELSPSEGPEACAYTAAKLAYKLMGYSVCR